MARTLSFAGPPLLSGNAKPNTSPGAFFYRAGKAFALNPAAGARRHARGRGNAVGPALPDSSELEPRIALIASIVDARRGSVEFNTDDVALTPSDGCRIELPARFFVELE